MFVFSIFFALLYLSKSNVEAMDGEQDAYHTLFGNIASMEDLFLKEPEDGKTPTTTSKPNTPPAPDDDFDSLYLEFLDTDKLNQANISNDSFDILDFSVINEKYSNITKEYKKNLKKVPTASNTRKKYYNDPDDYYVSEFIEDLKRKQLMTIMVQYVLHCRYEVGKALLQRNLVRDDKRYKLGYLFNRMRRLKTEQLKMVAVGYNEVTDIGERWRYMYSIMRLYERVVHFDVDMRDTAALIRRIFNVDAPYDKIELKKKATS